jgi:hypothetical protein
MRSRGSSCLSRLIVLALLIVALVILAFVLIGILVGVY